MSGRAWEIGILAGLARADLDLSQAGTFVGTSAGALVASCVAWGQEPQALYQQHLQADLPTEATMVSPAKLLRVAWLFVRHWGDPAAFRTESAAVASRVPGDVTPGQLSDIARLLPTDEWPDKRLILAAVDGDSGQAVALTSAAGIGLVRAVAASTTLPGARPPVAGAGYRMMDGGFRSAVNADLAAGCDPIVIIAPTLAGFGPIRSGRGQLAQLRRHATVVTITPDARSLKAMGINPMNDANRPASARAGHRQGMAVAAAVTTALR